MNRRKYLFIFLITIILIQNQVFDVQSKTDKIKKPKKPKKPKKVKVVYGAIDEGYGEANDNLGQFTDTFENSDNITVMDDVIRNTTLECIELNYTSIYNKTMVFSPVQLREHKNYASFNPDVLFTRISPYIRGTSSIAGLGSTYMMITVDRDWLDGKYVRVNWKHGAYGYGYIRIYEGNYNRSSMVDFPSGSGMLLKGGGLLQTVASTNTGPITSDVLIDTSGGSETNCTIFIMQTDAWSSQTMSLYLYWLEINDSPNGNDNHFTWNLYTGTTLTMEVTGTVNDYGKVTGGSIEDYEFLMGGYSLSGYFITDDYLNYTTGNSLTLLTNASIPDGTTMTVQFSNDNVTWLNNEGNVGSTSIEDGFYAIDLRNLNYTDDYKMVNFTGTQLLTPRLYQLREVTTNGTGGGVGDIVYVDRFPSHSLIMLIFLLTIGSILIYGVYRRK